MARAEQAFHGHIAESPRRHVRNAQQADVVVRVDEDLQIGEKIADFRPVKETLATNQMVTDAGRAKRGFKRTRLHIRPEQNGVVQPGDPVCAARKFNLFDQVARFIIVIGVGAQNNLVTPAFARPELFGAAAHIVFDDGVGGIKDDVCRAVILFELDDFHLREMFFQVEQVADFSTAPAVNTLVVVAHHAEIPVLGGEGMNELELCGVGVLIFVRHHVTIFGAARFEHVRMFVEQPQREQDEIVEVHGVAGVQGGFVA